MMTFQAIFEENIASRLAARLQSARRLHDHFKGRLPEDRGLQEAVATLCRHASAVSDQMTAMALGSLCSRCASRPKGGCCSIAIAEETDELQLLMNLLAGVEVHLLYHDSESCPFLGPGGCQFFFKPMYCLNYTCQRIHEAASMPALSELERLTGLQLQHQYTLEQLLRERIHRERTSS
jgi:hypothetical protein